MKVKVFQIGWKTVKGDFEDISDRLPWKTVKDDLGLNDDIFSQIYSKQKWLGTWKKCIEEMQRAADKVIHLIG